MQRTFIALKISPEKEMMDCILHLQDALQKEKIKWVDPGQLHITLQFLGDTDPARVASTIRMLEKTVPEFPAPEVEFKGLGLFRNLRDPNVIWIGMDPGPILPALKTSIERQLSQHKFIPEERKFTPHLTLGRIKSTGDMRSQKYHPPQRNRRIPSDQPQPRNKNSRRENHPREITGILEELLQEYRDSRFQKNQVKQLHYIESILRPTGPEYLTLRSFSFSITQRQA